MKPNVKSYAFMLSMFCFALFIVQLALIRVVIMHGLTHSSPIPNTRIAYWSGLLWISLGATFYYRASKYKQTPLGYALVFLLAPLATMPLHSLLYTVIVIMPIYDSAGASTALTRLFLLSIQL